MPQKPNYKFQENLLKLSFSQKIDTALGEWTQIYEETLPEQTGLCICQRRIKRSWYMFNLSTKYNIRVGIECRKKFNGNEYTGRINKTLQRNILQQFIRNGLMTGYGEILDILKYAMEIKSYLMESLRRQITNTTNMNVLQELYDDITELINDYNVEYLQEIRDEIERKMIDERRKIAEYEQREKTRIIDLEKQKQEQENQSKLREQQEEERKTREQQRQKQEQELAEQIRLERSIPPPEKIEPKCACGLSITRICRCEAPRFEICKPNQQLICKNARCQKWKCRCELALSFDGKPSPDNPRTPTLSASLTPHSGVLANRCKLYS